MADGAQRLLEQHNGDRLAVTGLLQQVREKNQAARGAARAAWHATATDDALEVLALQFEEKLAELMGINEQAQRKAIEIINALRS